MQSPSQLANRRTEEWEEECSSQNPEWTKRTNAQTHSRLSSHSHLLLFILDFFLVGLRTSKQVLSAFPSFFPVFSLNFPLLSLLSYLSTKTLVGYGVRAVIIIASDNITKMVFILFSAHNSFIFSQVLVHSFIQKKK